MSLADIKILVREYKIKGVSHLNKKDLIAKLSEQGVPIPSTPSRRAKPVASEPKIVSPQFDRLKTIRQSPRAEKKTDTTTGETKEFKSMFSAGKFLGHSSKIISDYANKVYKNTYKIEILDQTKPTESDEASLTKANTNPTESDEASDTNNAKTDLTTDLVRWKNLSKRLELSKPTNTQNK